MLHPLSSSSSSQGLVCVLPPPGILRAYLVWLGSLVPGLYEVIHYALSLRSGNSGMYGVRLGSLVPVLSPPSTRLLLASLCWQCSRAGVCLHGEVCRATKNTLSRAGCVPRFLRALFFWIETDAGTHRPKRLPPAAGPTKKGSLSVSANPTTPLGHTTASISREHAPPLGAAVAACIRPQLTFSLPRP
jgi:hypothetical protein